MAFRDSHTNYEWALQEAANIVEPFGEKRADWRAAINTMQVLAAMLPEMSAETFHNVYELLKNYTGDRTKEDPDEMEANHEALAALEAQT